MKILLDSPVLITLEPPGDATGIGLDAAGLDRLDTGRGPVKLITPSSRGWLPPDGPYSQHLLCDACSPRGEGAAV